MKKLLMTLVLLAAGLILFSLTAILLIPSDMLMSSVKERLKTRHSIILTEESSRRVLPFGIRVEGLTVSNRAGNALYLDAITARFVPLALLSGGLMVNFDATVAGGAIRGYVLLKNGAAEISAVADAIELDAIEAISDAGFKGPGALSGTASAKFPATGCPEATLNLKALGLDGENLKFKGIGLPFGEIKDAGLKAKVNECRAEILNLWIDGAGLSARVSGPIKLKQPLSHSVIDLHIEMVPRGTEDPILSLLFNHYRKSANYYSIKVKGTLEKPTVRP